MARLRERSKMDWNTLTTVNQQKNKCSALLVCWIPHGRLWAVYLVWLGPFAFNCWRDGLLMSNCSLASLMFLHRKPALQIDSDMFSASWCAWWFKGIHLWPLLFPKKPYRCPRDSFCWNCTILCEEVVGVILGSLVSTVSIAAAPATDPMRKGRSALARTTGAGWSCDGGRKVRSQRAWINRSSEPRKVGRSNWQWDDMIQ